MAGVRERAPDSRPKRGFEWIVPGLKGRREQSERVANGRIAWEGAYASFEGANAELRITMPQIQAVLTAERRLVELKASDLQPHDLDRLQNAGLDSHDGLRAAMGFFESRNSYFLVVAVSAEREGDFEKAGQARIRAGGCWESAYLLAEKNFNLDS